MRTTPWPVLAGIGLALLSASVASAAGPASTAAISNGVLALGVSSDGGLAQGGLGVKFAPTGTDGLPASCACGVRLTVGSTTLSESIESFTFTATTANSSVLATDPASGTQLRMTQDFHPSTVAPNLYEVVVTVDNLGSSAVQATYARGLTWLTPTHEFDVALPSIAPGGSVAFRLYIGAGTSLGDATSGFVPEGASLVAQLPGATTFVFGYAAGQTPGPSGSGGSGGSGGGGGGGGGGGAGGSGGGAPSGNAGAVDAGQPQAASSATSATPTATSTTSTSTSTSASTSASAAATAASLGGTPTATTTTSGATPTSTAANSTPTPTTVTNATPTATSATPTATSTEVPKSTATPVVKLDLDPPSDPIGSLPGFEPQATPELDSLTLMASGLGGIGVYALARWRARKRDRD